VLGAGLPIIGHDMTLIVSIGDRVERVEVDR
jgi:hypothetical protein